MMLTIAKFCVGVCAVPLAIGSTVALYHNLSALNGSSSAVSLFSWGVVSYVVLHLFFFKPTAVYVFGHELVHALAAWLCGGSVTSFSVGKNGGKVTATKSNMFITLSPYFVPLYTIIIATAYFVLMRSSDTGGRTFIFLIGLSLAFHIIMTIDVLKMRQPDMIRSGPFFSVVLVYIVNIFVISGVFSILFSEFKLVQYLREVFTVSRDVYYSIFCQLFK